MKCRELATRLHPSSSFFSPPSRTPSFAAAKMQKDQHFQYLPKYFAASRRNSGKNWRIQITQTQLVSQISTVLLQRHNKFWVPILRPLNLSSILTPTIFLQILDKIQTNPKVCLNFFNWVQDVLDFKPDLKVKCELTQMLFRAKLCDHGRYILDSFIQDHPPSKIMTLLIRERKNVDLGDYSPVFDSVIECYCRKQMQWQSLEVYQMARQYGFLLSLGTCNSLLNLLNEKNELRLAWCCYASIIRNGVTGDHLTWSIITNILYKDGKFDRVLRIFDMGIYSPVIFGLMVDGYSKRGEFEAAFGCLTDMYGKRIEPSFGTYSSLLDGACRFQDIEVIDKVISLMVEKGHISELPSSDYNSIISKLCDLRKTFAMDLFYERACDENVELQPATYGSMLIALSSVEHRMEDAIRVYNIMQEKNIVPSNNCYNAFAISLCRQNPSQEISKMLVDIVRTGLVSVDEDISRYISKQFLGYQWNEAEELLNVALDQGCLFVSHSCSSFIKHYCSSRRLNEAIELHKKLKGLNRAMDTATYNIFLDALFKEDRMTEAAELFDYMRTCKTFDSESFSVAIRGFCQVKELRKAMKLHDEMLELGLKPDQRTYKRLICGFR